jgi:glycogen operon protein
MLSYVRRMVCRTALCLALSLGVVACSEEATSSDGSGGGLVSGAGGADGSGGEGGAAGAAGAGGEGGASSRSLLLRVRSERASRIDVYVYAAATGGEPVLIRTLAHTESDAWTATVTAEELTQAGVSSVAFYGLRAWGPNWPFDPAWSPGSNAGFVADVDADGNRFNPNKLLLDPYATELSHDPTTPEMLDSTVYLTGPDHRDADSGAVAPKGVFLLAEPPAVELGERPTRPLSDDTIYEVHVRGFTMSDPSVAEPCRGTYRGAAEKADYLADLGVTAIELLPIHETPNSTNDVEASTAGDNYWGYSTLGFFAPDRRYACDKSPGGPTREVREMVKAMHDRGIKVFLDVVYNHTWEGGVGDPRVTRLHSLRGLDNAGYYELAEDRRFYVDNTGTGANTSARSPMFRDLVQDSLTYWHEELGIDGFRFDLASALADGCPGECFEFQGDDPGGILARAVTELPARDPEGGPGVDLIAEPWAIGAGTYQVGHFPHGFAEWNGIYRDTLRRDQNRLAVDEITPRQLLHRVVGSPDLYADDGRSPAASVNFLVSHDGFTLRDLYACNEKDNDQPWPYGPSDGGENHNLSWDYGGDPARQRQAWRTGLALLSLSAGAPMLTGGDELYRTQACNNNTYNLDAFTNWLDWSSAELAPEMLRFARETLRFRRAHPALRPTAWPSPEDPDDNGLGGWVFLTDAGTVTTDAYLDTSSNHFLAWRVDGEAAGDSARSVLVLYNGYEGTVFGALPPTAPGLGWYLVLDTASSAEAAGNVFSPGEEPAYDGASYDVAARSVVVMIEK